MKFYTKVKVIRISENQLKTLQKMKSYNIEKQNRTTYSKTIRISIRNHLNGNRRFNRA